MGLDLYAGTLTRYYNRNWKTVVQQWAEANDIEFAEVRQGEDASPDDLLSAETVETAVSEWRDSILKAIPQADERVYVSWIENNFADYYTDKPDWIAFGALILYCACKKYELEMPRVVRKGWNFSEDEIVARAYADEQLSWTLFSDVEWWIPIDDTLVFRCQTPNGVDVMIGTTGALLSELDKINELGWQATPETIIGWANTEGYPTDATIADGKYEDFAEKKEYDTESLAKLAFSIFYQAAKFSAENKVPILMDY